MPVIARLQLAQRLPTPEERAAQRRGLARAKRQKAAFTAWLESERADGREPGWEARAAERERIRGAVR